MSVIPIQPHSAARGISVPPPLALYIHIPWCLRKCPYCDFNSHEAREGIPEAGYIDALLADLEHALPLVWGRRPVSLFFGGGTPSLFSPQGIDRLLAGMRALLPWQPDAEITLEANPGTVESGRFAEFRAVGINRVSLGIQSFNHRHLLALGRVHDGNEARNAAEIAARHFETFNLDLMQGLPGQSAAEAAEDLDTALSFRPPHLSCYQLTLEPNTRFAADPPADLPDADRAADMQEAAEQCLAAASYRHYETSAYALPGHECRHNLNYWHFGDYLGIGAGAHSKLTLPDGIVRQMRWKHPEAYLRQTAAGKPVQDEHRVAEASLCFEFLMNALRLEAGFPPALYTARTGRALEDVMPLLKAAAAEGMLVVSAERIFPTEMGRRFLNVLLERFLPG